QRRPAHGARHARRHEALGIPNGRRHELPCYGVRASRQGIRRRVLRRQPVRGFPEGRQRLAVQLGRHTAARAARRRCDAVLARLRRHHESRRGQDGVRQRVHVLPRRARRRRARWRQAARRRAQRRARDPDRKRGPQGHAAVRRGVDRGADSRRRRVRRDTVAALNAQIVRAIVALVVVSASMRSVAAPKPSADAVKRANAAKPALVDPPRDGWPTNGGNWYNQRYSPLTQIDRSNVGKLKGLWRARLDGSAVAPQYSGEAQPLVVDGSVYIATGANDAFAIDVDSGAVRWRYHANLDAANKSVCCGWTNRGVAYGDG